MADSQDIFFSYLRGNNLTRKHWSNTEATFCIRCCVGDEHLVKPILLRPVQTTQLFFSLWQVTMSDSAMKAFSCVGRQTGNTESDRWLHDIICGHAVCTRGSWVPKKLVKECQHGYSSRSTVCEASNFLLWKEEIKIVDPSLSVTKKGLWAVRHSHRTEREECDMIWCRGLLPWEALCPLIGQRICCRPQSASQTTWKMQRNPDTLVFGVARRLGRNVGYFSQ